MNQHQAAYLRRSQEGGITKDDEIAALKALAVREGANGDLVWYDDWGHSADELKDRQDRLRDLIADMRAGKINLVIAGKMDRLARSVSVFAKFAAATKENHVRFVTVAEGDMSEDAVDDDPFKWASRQFMVTMAEMELRTIKARVRRAKRVREERGDKMGQPPYGCLTARDPKGRIVHVPDPARPASVVVDAYLEAGSIMGASKLLRERGIPAPKGGTRWGQSTTTRILEANAPGVLPRKGASGRRTPTTALLGSLLVCHCGHTLTPNLTRGQYYCSVGHREGAAKHGKMAVREVDLLPWVRAEVEHIDLGGDRVQASAEMEAKREAIAARIEAAGDNFYAGAWTAEKRDRIIVDLRVEMDALQSTEDVQDLGNLDDLWTWAPRDTNATLRAILERVVLGPDLRPVSAVWRNPALRRACDDPACTHCPTLRSDIERPAEVGKVARMTGAEMLQTRLAQNVDDLTAGRITPAQANRVTGEASRELRKISAALRAAQRNPALRG